MNLQKQITECRRYEQNGFPRYLKREIFGIRKNLEYHLDRMKAESRDYSTELKYAN